MDSHIIKAETRCWTGPASPIDININLQLRDCSLTAVGPKHEGVETALVPQMVQHRDIGVHVVDVIGVGWVLAVCPLIRGLQGGVHLSEGS